MLTDFRCSKTCHLWSLFWAATWLVRSHVFLKILRFYISFAPPLWGHLSFTPLHISVAVQNRFYCTYKFTGCLLDWSHLSRKVSGYYCQIGKVDLAVLYF